MKCKIVVIGGFDNTTETFNLDMSDTNYDTVRKIIAEYISGTMSFVDIDGLSTFNIAVTVEKE